MGSVTRMPDVPGLAEHGHEIKSLTDAVALRDRAIEMLEAANLEPDPARRRSMLHFVIVGGNYTGVEVAGEFQAFFSEARRQYPALRRDDYRITLVELRDRILPALGDDLANYAAEKMDERGIDIRTGESVECIEAASATLSGGDVLLTRTVIWCAGVAPPPLVARMRLPVDDRGYIECERDLRVRGFDNVWAIGDCAVNRDADGHPYPATAQHAVKQAKHAAKNIQRVLSGEPTEPCDIRTTGSLAALGCRTAVADVLGVKVAGFAAWWLWRTVYLLKMPGWGRRLRIAADWTLDLLSRRELVQLGVHRPAARHADDEKRRNE
jgi:NADH dehydrogenase